MIPITQNSVIKKSKRVLKYIIVLFAVAIVCGMADAAIRHWIPDPWFTFAGYPNMLMGAMIYRLIATWEYE